MKNKDFKDKLHDHTSAILNLFKMEEEPLENEVEAHKTRIRNRKKAKAFRLAFIVVCILLVILAVVTLVDRVRYTDYKVIDDSVITKKDNVSVYRALNDDILRYSSDGASLMNQSLKSRWNVTYTMTDPQADTCAKAMVIYDKGGTDVRIFDRNGSVGEFKTSSPIVKARVSAKGNVAVLLHEGDAAVIRYFTSSGGEIAVIASTLKSTGYPVDFDISENGRYLAVSFASLETSSVGSVINFYDFGSGGQSFKDNIVSTVTYEAVLVPQITWMADGSCAAIRDDGFVIFKGQNLAPAKEVMFDQDIISFFHDDERLGFIFRSLEGEAPYVMNIYGTNGLMKATGPVNIEFDNVSISGDQIILTSSRKLGIYTMKGDCRFEGELDEGSIVHCIHLTGSRYLLVTNAKTEMIRLTK
ncbi:MAG: DUF5711 family protein [Lachnospiraceae bacterium]|nr:DUF5711 family protein [Lachnospiraceae bacterium]